MPIIPLSQIPNAPQTGAGLALSGFVGGPNVDSIQLAQPINSQGMRADTSGISRAQSLLGGVASDIVRGANVGARAMDNYRAGNVTPEMFGNFSGFTAVGEAVAQAGSVINDFAMRQARAKDTVDLARVDSTLRDAFSGFLIEIEQNQIPETEWLKTWQDSVPQIREQIGKLGISGRIAADVEADLIRFGADSQMDVAMRATRRSQEVAKGTLFNSVEKAFLQGDYEVAYDLLDRGVSDGLMRADEAEGQRMKLEGLKRNEDIAQAISDNPEAVVLDMREARETGKSNLFDNMKPSEIDKVERAASSALRNRQVDEIDSIDERVLTGDIRTPEQLNAAIESAGVTIPEAQKRSLVKSLVVEAINSPEGQAAYKAARSQLMTDVAAYDPATDVDDALYWDLKDQVKTTMQEGDRAEMLADLSTVRKSGRAVNAQLQSSLFTTIDKMRAQGLLGDTGLAKDGRTINNLETYIATEQMALETKEWVRSLLRSNPQISSEEAHAKFRERLGSSSDQAAKMWDQQQKTGFGGFFVTPHWMSSVNREQGTPPAAPTRQEVDAVINGAPIGASLPPGKKDIAAQLTAAATQAGIRPGFMVAMVMQESSFDPNKTVAGSSARGLFQLLKADRQKWGVSENATVEEQIAAGIKKTTENLNAAKKALGREPTDGELYVVHYQGIGAGPKILANPDGSFRDTLNQFGSNWYGKVIKANPWLKNIKTNGEFIAWATDKIEERKKQLAS